MRIGSRILAEHGRSAYSVYLPEDAAPAEEFAARELISFFEQITDVCLPLRRQLWRGEDEYLICIRDMPNVRPVDTVIDRAALSDEEIVIRTEGYRLLLTGGSPRGVLYSVYQFLEDYLGVRFFAPDCTHVPHRTEIVLPDIDFRYKPCFIYRNCFVFSAVQNPLWAVRNRLNAVGFYNFGEYPEYGGFSYHAPACHSFYALVPPEEYFDTHPEYFSLIDGKRDPHSQLCLSNPDVFDIVLTKMRKKLKESKNIGVDMAQNDWLGACQCENCRRIDEKYHAFSGSIITFCNRLAEALEDEFPDRLVQTYAYQYGQTCPDGIKAHKNVAVWLCSIESCFCHPHGTCDTVRRELRSPDGRNPFFPRDIQGWRNIADNLFVWNYNTNFRNFLLPHPNLHVLGPNLRFFRDNGVKGVFEQNCTTSPHTEMQELRAYILAKCLWDPDYDDRQALEEFTDCYFGSAASSIRAYVDMLRDTVMDRSKDMHLLMSTMPPNPNDPEDFLRSSLTRSSYERYIREGKTPPTHGICKYMTPESCARAEQLFDRAEAMADDEIILERVRIARLAIRYYRITTMRNDEPGRREMIDEFFADCNRYGITDIREAAGMDKAYDAVVNNKGMY